MKGWSKVSFCQEPKIVKSDFGGMILLKKLMKEYNAWQSTKAIYKTSAAFALPQRKGIHLLVHHKITPSKCGPASNSLSKTSKTINTRSQS